MDSNSEARTTCTSKMLVISLPSRKKIKTNPPILFICVFEHIHCLNLLNVDGGRAHGTKALSTNRCKMWHRCHCCSQCLGSCMDPSEDPWKLIFLLSCVTSTSSFLKIHPKLNVIWNNEGRKTIGLSLPANLTRATIWSHTSNRTNLSNWLGKMLLPKR